MERFDATTDGRQSARRGGKSQLRQVFRRTWRHDMAAARGRHDSVSELLDVAPWQVGSRHKKRGDPMRGGPQLEGDSRGIALRVDAFGHQRLDRGAQVCTNATFQDSVDVVAGPATAHDRDAIQLGVVHRPPNVGPPLSA